MQQTHSEQGEKWVGNKWAKILLQKNKVDGTETCPPVVAWVGQQMITLTDMKHAPVETYHIGGCI